MIDKASCFVFPDQDGRAVRLFFPKQNASFVNFKLCVLRVEFFHGGTGLSNSELSTLNSQLSKVLCSSLDLSMPLFVSAQMKAKRRGNFYRRKPHTRAHRN